MNVSKWILVSLCLFLDLRQNYLYGQEKSKVQYGKVAPSDFTLPASSVIDTNTNAVVIADIGETHFTGNDKGYFSYVFKRQIRLKIINKKGFRLGTVKIPLRSRDDDAEKLDKLEATTYNLEDGKVVESKLEKKEVFDDRLSRTYLEKKFTMPALKEGSIIEYTYTITSNFIAFLPPWRFQSEDCPALWSEYDVEIPATYNYIMSRRGIHNYYIDKGGEGSGSYRITEKDPNAGLGGVEHGTTLTAMTVKHRWVIKDVPVFHIENYISSPENYIDKLEFQLAQMNNGRGGWDDFRNNWKKVNEELLRLQDFGGPLRDDNNILGSLAYETSGKAADPLEQARAIYSYVTSHFTCTNYNYPFISTNLDDVLRKRNGTVGDINLLLVALLRKRSIIADPVLLSTRAHGFAASNYPVLDRYNYVIARVSLSGKVYYLDACHSQLGFGQLSLNCYNGSARIISEKDSGFVHLDADSLREKKTTMVLLTGKAGGGLEGSYQSTHDFPGSYNVRERVSEIGLKAYFKNIQAEYGDEVEISNTGIDSLDNPQMPVKVYYDLTFKQLDNPSLIYLNPLFADALHENPFKALERKYPVEMPFAMEHSYIFNMEIPPGYKIDELPKSARVALNGKEGIYEYLIAVEGNSIQMRTHIRLEQADFTAEDYQTLRDFFAFIVKKESEQIVLKKQ